MLDTLGSFGPAFMDWADPWWFIIVSALLGLIIFIAPLPLRLDHHELLTRDAFIILLRRLILLALGCLFILFPMVVFVSGSIRTRDVRTVFTVEKNWIVEQFGYYWTIPVLGIVLGMIAKFIWKRHIMPRLSNFFRSIRTEQKTEKQSDIRDEMKALSTKDFNPKEYYRINEKLLFLGLDDDDAPIYVPLSDYMLRNMLTIGPTRFGKGVLIGCQIDQLVRMGVPTWYLDPKEDEHIPYIMANAAKEMGVDFLYLDLNPEGYGLWSPFSGGSDRDKRARVIQAFGLGDTGSDADFYKLGERTILDEILKKTGGYLLPMLEEAKKRGDDVKRLSESLREWSGVSTFHTRSDGRGQFSVERSIESGAVVYVRGSISDGIVKRALRSMIKEIVQESNRLWREGRRQKPLVIQVDEVKFVMSEELTDALATSLGSRVKLALATQSIGDLKKLEDRTLNGEAICESLMTNCQEKIIHCAATPETAEWASALGGSKWIQVVRSETTEINKFGGEEWGEQRVLNRVEEAVISENQMKALPPRVSVFFVTNELPRQLFSCWVRYDKNIQLHKPLRQKSDDKSNTPPQPKPTGENRKNEEERERAENGV